MTATATSRSAAPRSPWASTSPAAASSSSPSSSSRARQKGPQPSSTPQGLPPGRTPASVGQAAAPLLSPRGHARTGSKGSSAARGRSPSPGYFGLTVQPGAGSPIDSDAGTHAKTNWKSVSSSVGSKAAASPQPIPHDQNPDFSEFRRQSEAYAMNVEHMQRFGSAAHPVPSSPLATAPVRTDPFPQGLVSPLATRARKAMRLPSEDPMDIDGGNSPAKGAPGDQEPGSSAAPRPSAAGSATPAAAVKFAALGQRYTNESSSAHMDERQHRLSLPHNSEEEPLPSQLIQPDSRSKSMPQRLSHDGPAMVDPSEVAQVLESSGGSERYLLLDLRVSPQYAASHIGGALNLCIPTTLLKRPSFNLKRLSDAFTSQNDKDCFAKWNKADYIIVYDASSAVIRDATSSINTLKKFSAEGWKGIPCIIKGGFQAFSKQFPDLVEQTGRPRQQADDGKGAGLSIQAGGGAVNVAGGCPMPTQKTAANPFFSNIRQNMDLIGGVGQVPVPVPDLVGPRSFRYFPQWLQEAARPDDQGKEVSEKFLKIEKDEQKRMQNALSTNVSYGSPDSPPASPRIAGIEKGSKNRYKDMLPYDHTRVRLQGVPMGNCDYVNASHVKAEWSNRHYIATQAPVPATFEDFWRVIWEQDVRVIVGLTAETEGGQQKCHPYWVSDTYGSMKVKCLSEKRVALSPPSTLASKVKRAQLGSPHDRALPPRRRGVTNPVGLAQSVQDAAVREANPTPQPAEIPHVLVRKLTLSHASFPFQPIREITQLHFSAWPDFGAISARDVLGLVEQTSAVARLYNGNGGGSSQAGAAALPVREGERPMAVHCSAGCGRTGTFCAIDSVIDMLKRQRGLAGRRAKREREEDGEEEGEERSEPDEMQVDGGGEQEWVEREDVDLVAKTVEDFRKQRLSMVQTLRQFVLCYEAVMEWLVRETPERFHKEQARRSFQGEIGQLH